MAKYIQIIYKQIEQISQANQTLIIEIIRLKIEDIEFAMKLYNIALKNSSTILKCLYGNFSASKQQEVILVKTRSIELYTINQSGKLQLLAIQDLFCIIRSVAAFRIHGTYKDRIIVGSDSGKVVILQYMAEKHRFVKTHEQTFGKSGCRRVVPGQHVAVDPRGRAVMIAAIQKQKFVYVLVREQDKTIIQSPRDAHKSHSICMDVVALDMGNENAMFVCLEIDYGQVEEKEALINVGGVRKSIVYYEMDFGMNSVIRKKQVQVDSTAHMLIPVPGCDQGPGGVIVLLEDFLLYRNDKSGEKSNDQSIEHVIRFPRRKERPGNRKVQFTAFTTYRGKGFFFLIASQLGDLFKVEFKLKDIKQIVSIKIQYFDTVSCLSSMALTKNGYLFCASEKQDHSLYTLIEREKKIDRPYTHSQMQNSTIVQFNVIKSQQERQIMESDQLQNFGPASDFKATKFGQAKKSLQMYMLNSSGPGKSYLRIIKQGLKVIEKKKVKFQTPQAMWSVNGTDGSQNKKLLVLGFQNKTSVFTMTEGSYVSTNEPGIETGISTIYVGRLRDNSLVQITNTGFRHITKNNVRPMKIQGTILKGTSRGGQMVLALQGGDIIYYELDQNGDLAQVQQTSLDDEVVDMDLTPIQKDRIRSNFLVVGLRGNCIKILDLSAQSELRTVSQQKTRDLIESIAVQEMEFENEEDEERYGKKLYIYAGLKKGIIVRTSIDTITGKMTDLTTYILGESPVKCIKMSVQGKPAILALAERPWLIYAYDNKQIINPLSYPHLDIAVSARNPTNPHTICGFCEKSLVFLALQNFGQMLHSEKINLTYSGKKLVVADNFLAILQSDRYATETQEVPKWRSQVSIFCPTQNKITHIIKMDENEVCTALAYCTIKQKEADKKFLALSCSTALTYYPKMSAEKNKIKIFEYKDKGEKDKQKEKCKLFQFYHETQIEDISLTLHPWEQKILAGVGNCMRAYEIGKKKILRKAEIKNLNSPINTIQSSGRRIFVTQLCDSFHMYSYKQKQQTFYDIADDILPRFITTTCNLDAYTMIGGDKFENIFVSRVPRNAQDDFDNNPNTYKFQWEHGYLNGAPFKMEQICSFYVGEIVTSIQRAQMESSGKQIILYSTINGGINALCPFESRENVDFFTHLEMYLSKLLPNQSGRDHLNYRSYYSPCKGVIDGDLCQVYIKLPYDEQVEIAKLLDLTPHEIHKKLEEMRRYLI